MNTQTIMIFPRRKSKVFGNYEIVLTTEKDYVRLAGRLENLYYLEVAHSFDAEDRKILENIVEALI